AYAGLKTIGGVLVSDFGSADSPAKRAGIQPGDLIVAVDGKPVEYVAQLQEAIAFRKPGDVVSVELARKGGQRTTARVTLQRADVEPTAGDEHNDASSMRGDRDRGGALPLLGISGVSSDDPSVRELAPPSDVRGIVVTDVTDASPAAGRLATPSTGG